MSLKKDGSKLALQTFEIRPTQKAPSSETKPDELMIDWGTVPIGSQATIYLPAVNINEVVDMASRMYPAQKINRVDNHTLQCEVGGISYIPIPLGGSVNLAGLLSVEITDTIQEGQIFKIIIRQVTSTRRIQEQPPNISSNVAAAAVGPPKREWRQVLGTFQIILPVSTKEELVEKESRLLSILRWIQEAIPPENRWFPVFQRYVNQFADHVSGLGGDPSLIGPSPSGEWQLPKPEEQCVTGKVCEVLFNCFGDFEGFVLETCSSQPHYFKSHEPRIGNIVLKACRDRLLVSICVDRSKPDKIERIIIRC